jgi:hypothetical protein
VGDKRRVNIKKERQVVTYAELWHTSWSLMKQRQSQEEGSFHQFMGSLVFTAFSLEGYLNHIGPRVYVSWDALERLAPKEKLDIIAEKIGLPVDYAKRPWGIMKELFGFRNDIAHGKSITIAEDRVVPLSDESNSIRDLAKTKWEKLCTMQNAERARRDVEEMVRALHGKADIKDEFPFIGGIQLAEATLLEEQSEKQS